MRSIIAWEVTDEQIRWSYELDDYIKCRVRIAGLHRDFDFPIDEWQEHLDYTGGDMIIALDYNNVLVLDEDDIAEKLMEHREAIINVDYAVSELEEEFQRIQDAIENVLQDMIENRREYSIADMQDCRDSMMRRIGKIAEEFEDACW